MGECVVAQRGRPRFEPTEEQPQNVEIMVGLGIPREDIRLLVRDANDKPISLKTLEKYFRDELDRGAARLNAHAGNFIVATFLGATAPKGTRPIKDERVRGRLAELFAKARLGWRETSVHQHEGKDGAKQIIFEISQADADI